jgi:hypothetical protein
MDGQILINLGGAALIAAIGWFCKAIWDAVHKLQEDIHQIEVDLPTNYIRRDEFQEGMKEIKEMLSKIFDKLDGKADKGPQ